jgi:hypothetical protein
MIIFDPSVIIQRIATQCGADTMKGDNKNPEIEIGIQYTGYKCAAVYCKITHIM